MDQDRSKTRSGRSIKYKNVELVEKTLFKKREKTILENVKKILEKTNLERSLEEIEFLKDNNEAVKKLEDLKKINLNRNLHNEIQIDEVDDLNLKCEQLASYINSSKYCICYTGAGISTSSSIPDYRYYRCLTWLFINRNFFNFDRGPNGLWTMLKKGIKIETPDFASVKPTYTHMILNELLNKNAIKHITVRNSSFDFFSSSTY